MTTSRERSPSNTMRELSWEEVNELCLRMAMRISNQFPRVKLIAGIQSGGIIPAAMVARHAGLECMTVRWPEVLRRFKVGDIILLDDVIDTGETFLRFKELIGIPTAALIGKPWANKEYIPDIVIEWTQDWIKFPWE